MLDKIHVKNFRDLKDIEIEPAKITLLVGPNGTGKTGIFHALCVLKQSFESNSTPRTLSMVGNEVNLGSREQVVSNNDVEKDIEITISNSFVAGDDAGNEKGTTEYTAISSVKHGKRKIKTKLGSIEGEIDFNHTTGNEIKFSNDTNEEPYTIDNSEGLSVFGTFTEDSLKTRSHYFDTRIIETFLENLQYVPVQRGISLFKTPISSEKPEKIVNALGPTRMTKDMLEQIHYEQRLPDLISKYTKRLFDKGVKPVLIQKGLGDIPGEQDSGTMGTSAFFDQKGSALAANSGFGLNQLAFLLVPLLSSKEGATVMIEEPEISLHPTAQRELMEIFIDIVHSQNKQIIITTHSEHFAIAIFNAIQKRKILGNEVKMYSFSHNDENETSISEIDNPEGAFKKFLGEEENLLQTYIQLLGKTDSWLTDGNIEN